MSIFKASIVIPFFVLLSLSTTLFAEEICYNAFQEHLSLLKKSDDFISKLESKSSHISAFEITRLQKDLTNRFKSLKYVLKTFNDSKNNCTPKVLSTALAIYDFSLVEKNIFNDKHMRRVVNSLTKYERYELTDYLDYHKKYTSNKLIKKVLREIEENNFILPSELIIEKTEAPVKTPIHKIADSTLEGSKSIIGGLARAWGFLSDSLKWREGHLKNNLTAISLLEKNLKPLDLIYEKRSFLLSDYTIPGHWGHVGIWLGSKEELVELGVWDQEYFKPFQSFVEEGMNILEIRKEGLNFQSLSTFINLDEIAINRVASAISRAPEIFLELNLQIDKKYDFKFDANSSDKITCSELIAFSYGDVSWKGSKALNQVNLRPDDLAILTLKKDSGVQFILYLKGIKNSEEFKDLDYFEWKNNFKMKKSKNQIQEKEIVNEREEERVLKDENSAEDS